jgi:threonine dehydratase
MLLVRGIASYALEFFRSAPFLEAVFVPIGWGSGAVAVAAARNALGLKTQIVGVVSANAPTAALSFSAGHVVEQKAQTRIADGIAISRVHEGSLRIMHSQLERVVTVTDDEVEEAMRTVFTDTHNIAEGAGAAAIAALLKDPHRLRGNRLGAVLTGGNVDRQVFARILAAGPNPKRAGEQRRWPH